MSDLLSIARQFAARPDDWPLAPRFDPLERWYHRLATHDDLGASRDVGAGLLI